MELSSSSGLYRCAAQEGEGVKKKGETMGVFELIQEECSE